jgi:hypothetical protein
MMELLGGTLIDPRTEFSRRIEPGHQHAHEYFACAWPLGTLLTQIRHSVAASSIVGGANGKSVNDGRVQVLKHLPDPLGTCQLSKHLFSSGLTVLLLANGLRLLPVLQ